MEDDDLCKIITPEDVQRLCAEHGAIFKVEFEFDKECEDFYWDVWLLDRSIFVRKRAGYGAIVAEIIEQAVSDYERQLGSPAHRSDSGACLGSAINARVDSMDLIPLTVRCDREGWRAITSISIETEALSFNGVMAAMMRSLLKKGGIKCNYHYSTAT